MKKRGAITIVFDDGYTTVYQEVLPFLRAYNIQAVFAVPLQVDHDSIEGEKITEYTKWLAAAAKDGHEIAAHGITHNNLTNLSDGELQEELIKPANILNATTLVYPGGAYNNTVASAAKERYQAGRTVEYGLNELSPEDPLRLKTINFSKRNFSVARANIHALRALIQNKWLIETYHMVSKNPSTLTHFVSLNDLDAHLDFITSLPIKIATIRDIL